MAGFSIGKKIAFGGIVVSGLVAMGSLIADRILIEQVKRVQHVYDLCCGDRFCVDCIPGDPFAEFISCIDTTRELTVKTYVELGLFCAVPVATLAAVIGGAIVFRTCRQIKPERRPQEDLSLLIQ